MLRKKVYILFLLYFATDVFSKEIIMERVENLKIGEYLSVYEDKNSQLSVDEVKCRQFKKIKSKTFHSGYTKSKFWFKGVLINNSYENFFYIAGIEDYSKLRRLYFSLDGNNFFENKKTMKESSKLYPAMKLNIKKGQKIYFLFSIESKGGTIRAIPSLETDKEYKKIVKNFDKNENSDVIATILFTGLSFLAYYLFKRKTLRYYLLHCFLLLLMVLYPNSYFYKILTPLFKDINTVVFLILIIPCITYRLLFLSEMLSLKRGSWLNYISITLVLGMFFIHLIYIFGIFNFATLITIRNIFHTLLSILYFITCFICIKNNKFAKYLAFGFFLPVLQNIWFHAEVLTKLVIVPLHSSTINFILLDVSQLVVLAISILSAHLAKEKSSDIFVESLEEISDMRKALEHLYTQLNEITLYDMAQIYLFKKNKYELLLNKFCDNNSSVISLEEQNILGTYLGSGIFNKTEIINGIFNTAARNEKVNPALSGTLLILPINFSSRHLGIVVLVSRYKKAYDHENAKSMASLIKHTGAIIESSRIVMESVGVEKSIKNIKFMPSDIQFPVNATGYLFNNLVNEIKKRFNGEIDESITDMVTDVKFALEFIKTKTEEGLAIVGSEKKTKFDVLEIHNTAKDFLELCNKKGVGLSLALRAPNNMELYAPKTGLINSVAELTMNAIGAFEDYDRPGLVKEIRVATEIREGKLYIEVYDNGKGIKKEEQIKIFGHYSSGKKFGSEVGGFGLGLANVKLVVESMGSNVNLESVENNFSRFSFLVDAIATAKETEAITESADNLKKQTAEQT